MPPRLFTLAEANALLPRVRTLIAGMLQARSEVLELQPQIWPIIERAAYTDSIILSFLERQSKGNYKPH